MDASTLVRRQGPVAPNFYSGLPEESTLQLSITNTTLMDMIHGILEGDGPVSPTFPTPVDASKAKVMQWAGSLAKIQSPVEAPPSPVYGNYDHSQLPRSPSPMGSMFSGSSHDSSSDPRTPTYSNPVPASRKFSWEEETKIPETPTRRPPPPPVLSVPDRSSSHNRTPSPNHVPVMKATITNLVEDFMPVFLPSPEDPVETKPSRPTNLRINTNFLPYPVSPTSNGPKVQFPQPVQPSIQDSHSKSPVSTKLPSPVRRSAAVKERSRELLRRLEGSLSPGRHSMGPPPPQLNKSVESKSRPSAPSRHSMPPPYPSNSTRLQERLRPHPRPPALSIVIEERSQVSLVEPVPVPFKNFDSRDRYHRRNSMVATTTPVAKNVSAEEYSRTQRYSMMPTPSKPIEMIQKPSPPLRFSVPVPARRTQQEIEAIPAAASPELDHSGTFERNLGFLFMNELFAKAQGLQFTMSRHVITMSKMEWVTEGVDGSRLLKCYEQTNSLSRRKNFFNTEGNQLFDLQRSTGSTRTAQSPKGTTLFSVKNASSHTSPYWVVSLGGDAKNSVVQWIAKGDEDLESLLITWGGFQVGRISAEAGFKKHKYSVAIAPEMNYAIMAALVTVFDDLRTDESC